MEIKAVRKEERGDMRPLARYLMDQAFRFYEDPENEKEFQKWKEAREDEEDG